jgi:hypothetical protein
MKLPGSSIQLKLTCQFTERAGSRQLYIFVDVTNVEHNKIVWTAGRVLKEASLWRRVEELDYEERKVVLKRLTGFLENFASQGLLQRRTEPQSIGYGNEIGFDYLPTRKAGL